MTETACVYTALFGGYEEFLWQPIAGESDLDFICFTDDPELESDTWRIEVVEPPLRSDPARSCRFPKLCAHRFLDEYDSSLDIDNSVMLRRPRDHRDAALGDGCRVRCGRPQLSHHRRGRVRCGDGEPSRCTVGMPGTARPLPPPRSRNPHDASDRRRGPGAAPPARRRRGGDGAVVGTTYSATRGATSCLCWPPFPTRGSRRPSASWTSGTTRIGVGRYAPEEIDRLARA